jgi:hypothetical protein
MGVGRERDPSEHGNRNPPIFLPACAAPITIADHELWCPASGRCRTLHEPALLIGLTGLEGSGPTTPARTVLSPRVSSSTIRPRMVRGNNVRDCSEVTLAGERSDRIGPRPDAYPPWPRDGAVLNFQELLTVDRTEDAITSQCNTNREPLPRRRLDFCRPQLCSYPVDDLVDAEIVLQRIGAGDVVIVFVLISPDRSAALVDFPTDGLERDRQVHVEQSWFIGDAQIEQRIRSGRRRLR